MTLNDLNKNEILEEGIFTFLKKFLNKTKKFDDRVTDSDKKQMVIKLLNELTVMTHKSAPKLRKWFNDNSGKAPIGNKLTKKELDTVNNLALETIIKIGKSLHKTPEKILGLNKKKVAAAIIASSMKKVTGHKEWVEASWIEMIIAKGL